MVKGNDHNCSASKHFWIEWYKNSFPLPMSFQDSCCRGSDHIFRVGMILPGLYKWSWHCTWISVQNMTFLWSWTSQSTFREVLPQLHGYPPHPLSTLSWTDELRWVLLGPCTALKQGVDCLLMDLMLLVALLPVTFFHLLAISSASLLFAQVFSAFVPAVCRPYLFVWCAFASLMSPLTVDLSEFWGIVTRLMNRCPLPVDYLKPACVGVDSNSPHCTTQSSRISCHSHCLYADWEGLWQYMCASMSASLTLHSLILWHLFFDSCSQYHYLLTCHVMLFTFLSHLWVYEFRVYHSHAFCGMVTFSVVFNIKTAILEGCSFHIYSMHEIYLQFAVKVRNLHVPCQMCIQVK